MNTTLGLVCSLASASSAANHSMGGGRVGELGAQRLLYRSQWAPQKLLPRVQVLCIWEEGLIMGRRAFWGL